jgi:cell division protein FtsW
VTGVQLPLISAGGTSLVLTLFIVGLLARFARSEPAAIEAQRGRTRGPLARIFLPIPESAVDPVRPRRQPDERPSARPAVGGGRRLVHAGVGVRQVPAPQGPSRPVAARPVPPREERGRPAALRAGDGPPRERIAPARNRRAGEPQARGTARRQPPPSGAPRRPGTAR